MGLIITVIICICVGVYIITKKNRNSEVNYKTIDNNNNNAYEDNHINEREIKNINNNASNLFSTRNNSYYIENNRIYTRLEKTENTSRQARIRNSRTNQVLTLKKGFLTYDIAVWDEYEKIGYLSKDLSEIITKRIDNGEEFECVVASVSGGLESIEYNVVIYDKESDQYDDLGSFNNENDLNDNYYNSEVEDNITKDENNNGNSQEKEEDDYNIVSEEDYDGNDSDTEYANSSYESDNNYSNADDNE